MAWPPEGWTRASEPCLVGERRCYRVRAPSSTGIAPTASVAGAGGLRLRCLPQRREQSRVAEERAAASAEQIVAALLAAAGLAPSPDEVAAMVCGYPALRAGLDSLYLPEADGEQPLPSWLLRRPAPR